ncbi:MAG: type II toxin-antitoxin system HicB family antitoxin [Streptosporangiaceae bacterium]
MSGQSATEYTVRVHNEPDGTWWAEVDELPGCFTSGHDLSELAGSLSEAISLYLSEPGKPVHVEVESEPGSVTEQRVLTRTA